MSYSTETFRRVYDDKNGAHIQIGPDGDSLGLVEIRTDTDKDNIEYWGSVRLTVPPDMARAIGQALIRVADEATQPQGQKP